MEYKYATIDIETTGLNRYKDTITWIGIGLSKGIGSSIAIKTFNINDYIVTGKQIGRAHV